MTDEEIQAHIRALDDDADELHSDMTPAVSALAEIGEPALPTLLGPLAASNDLTRLRAQRALEGIVYQRHGFRGGQGFPGRDAEDAARADLVAIGYAYDADQASRDAAIARLREQIETP
jgi:hypothetical protein